MTVQELIDKLREFPADMPVTVMYEDFPRDIRPHRVEQIKATKGSGSTRRIF